MTRTRAWDTRWLKLRTMNGGCIVDSTSSETELGHRLNLVRFARTKLNRSDRSRLHGEWLELSQSIACRVFLAIDSMLRSFSSRSLSFVQNLAHDPLFTRDVDIRSRDKLLVTRASFVRLIAKSASKLIIGKRLIKSLDTRERCVCDYAKAFAYELVRFFFSRV